MPIYKYPVPIRDDFKIEMPMGAQVLTVATQNGKPYIWVLVDNNVMEELHPFKLVGTGHPSNDVSGDRYIGTFQMQNGAIVFHLFHGRNLGQVN